MAANNSSSSSPPPPPPSSSSPPPPLPLNMDCFVTPPTSAAFLAFTVTNFLLLFPLCTFILHHGVQRWRRTSSSSSSSSSSSAAPMSHFDVLTYHMVVMELVRALGGVLCCLAVLSGRADALLAGTLLLFFTWYGQLFFHVLGCLERHLAAVHPTAYLRLRGGRGVRIRNGAVGGVWLICSAKVALLQFDVAAAIGDLCLFVLTIVLVSCSSLRVLWVLLRPGPGDRGRRGVSQTKRRALFMMAAILGVLVLRVSWNVVWAVLHVFGGSAYCATVVSEIWINVSNSLVAPLLFLQREGRLSRWRRSARRAPT